MSHDDPRIAAPEQCRYDAAAEVPESFLPHGLVQCNTLPCGSYASLPFKGTSAQIGAAWQGLLRDWLSGSGLQLDARHCFEYYVPGAAYDIATGVFECDIVVPVVPVAPVAPL